MASVGASNQHEAAANNDTADVNCSIRGFPLGLGLRLGLGRYLSEKLQLSLLCSDGLKINPRALLISNRKNQMLSSSPYKSFDIMASY